MSVKTDPTLYSSDFERNELDRYWTGAAEAAAIARRVPDGINAIWEPAAGRGDLAKVLQDFGNCVFASDIDLSEFDEFICPVERLDFLTGPAPGFFVDAGIDMIVTNPPFGKEAEAFVRRALSYQHVRACAFLLRSEWKHAKTRMDLFTKEPFAKEIVLTWRPRWDWWFREKPEAGPRHNFSWFMWDRAHIGPPVMEWATREK